MPMCFDEMMLTDLLEDNPSTKMSMRVVRLAVQRAASENSETIRQLLTLTSPPVFFAASALTPLSFNSAIARLTEPGIHPSSQRANLCETTR